MIRSLLMAAVLVSLIGMGGGAAAKGPKVRTASPNVPAAKTTPPEKPSPAGPTIHLNATRPAAAQPTAQAAAPQMNFAPMASAAPTVQATTEDESRRRSAASLAAAQRKLDEQEAARKAAETKVAEEAAAAAAAERRKAETVAREARRKSLASAPEGCIIKPVMSDEDLAKCR